MHPKFEAHECLKHNGEPKRFMQHAQQLGKIGGGKYLPQFYLGSSARCS
jgi:hypothetical protein